MAMKLIRCGMRHGQGCVNSCAVCGAEHQSVIVARRGRCRQDYARPTPDEAAQVHALLAAAHPQIAPARPTPDADGNAAQTCGGVPNVLESLIGTILSQNTSGHNSTAAKRSLDARFGRNNFEAIAAAPAADVVAAIKMGGLANKKAVVIQNVLRAVRAKHGAYSLQHLAGVAEGSTATAEPFSDEEAMRELVSYDGVGPKTASCVLLFCLGRSSFPVDTHVFRLSKLLGWVPSRADRITAQAHLDLKIPDDLKYGLHVLMVGHGRRCKGCKGGNGGKGECILKKWLKERRGVKDEELETLVLKAEEDAAA
ncbi:DNA glycosylase [Wolfiporia cocos MD-104 SS10]|uniref:DNA glycosylase n=1 Tax=Wolfiporia cocos (strain MD-104) TaxID=742152 RepID=A0A2H3IYL0_WOLCO|nr:DNA glycosylase [Wolfiporia cocos MD-104 SS10]